MKEENESKNLFNLVLFELEKYCKTVSNHPRVCDDANYAELRTSKVYFHRAIHWYLHDNGLVYQTKGPAMDVNKEEYAILWQLKNFDKKIVCQEILDKYEDYLKISPIVEKIDCVVNYSIETVLKEKGKDKELSEIFENLNKKYNSDIDIVIAEYNKLIINMYAEMVYRKK
ncbi:MAG: hypothetical protein PHN56_03415 [Candidatus Nanoarchaeia archaeon]|nr:hypothetical protein [Candidatus Nanoarchaeia archaeon]